MALEVSRTNTLQAIKQQNRHKMKNTLLTLFFFTLISCNVGKDGRKEIILERIEEFNEEKQEWNNLTQCILKDETVNHKLGQLISPDDLDKSIADKLNERKIKYISVRNSLECREVEYQKDWDNSIGTQYLKYITCDTLKAKKGYYQSDSSPVEVFGIGDNWLIWIDIDPI